MRHDQSLRAKLILCFAATLVAASGLTVRAVAPTAPSGLTATVNGLAVTLNWTASANLPTQYILQAGFAPGQTAITVPLSAASTIFSASASAGTYYVRVIASNADGTSAPSNEVTVVLTSGCAAPGAPLNLRAIIRGGEAFIFWQRPAGGTPTGYTLQAGSAPGQTFTAFPTGGQTLNANVANGTYFIRVIANSACGTSAASNELVVSFPGNTVRVADPDPGTSLGVPDVGALVNRIHNENPGSVANSCPTGRKYETNPYQDRIVDRLRQYDTRFGYNAKPTRTAADNNGFPVIAAGDEISFFTGGGVGQGSSNVQTFDILFDHCGANPQQNVFRNIAPEPSIWTSAGRFQG